MIRRNGSARVCLFPQEPTVGSDVPWYRRYVWRSWQEMIATAVALLPIWNSISTLPLSPPLPLDHSLGFNQPESEASGLSIPRRDIFSGPSPPACNVVPRYVALGGTDRLI